MRVFVAFSAFVLLTMAGGASFLTQTPASDYSSGTQRDLTPDDRVPNDVAAKDPISAFYGLDESWRIWFVGYRLCAKVTGGDGMPVVFPRELDIRTIEAADVRETLASGRFGHVDCVTLGPALEKGELRTLLMIGGFKPVETTGIAPGAVGNLPLMVLAAVMLVLCLIPRKSN